MRLFKDMHVMDRYHILKHAAAAAEDDDDDDDDDDNVRYCFKSH